MEGETFLPASQLVGLDTATGQTSQTIQASQAAQLDTNQNAKTTKAKKGKEKEPAATTVIQYPCIYCGKSAAKGAVQCTICALWCHMTCTGLSKEAIKGLEVQAKEVGLAYWACRACMNFNTKWNNQMRQVCKRQDETEARVESNSDKIEEVRKMTEELRHELREQVKKTEGIQERMELVMDAELREREARRLNLVIHGLPEPEDGLKEPRERMERDKEECERLFIAMKARTRYQGVRFCRRIGERGTDPRPVVFGVYSEDEKRHLLEKSKELKYTRYENVTVVPDMTKSQRRGEQKLRDEADNRNAQLSDVDRAKNLKWIIVGKRGEKRLIKGLEREGQWGRQERDQGLATVSSGWNPQISVSSAPPNRGGYHNSNQRFNSGTDRRPGGQDWRPNGGGRHDHFGGGYRDNQRGGHGGGGNNCNNFNGGGGGNNYNNFNGVGGGNNYNNFNGGRNSGGDHGNGSGSYGTASSGQRGGHHNNDSGGSRYGPNEGQNSNSNQGGGYGGNSSSAGQRPDQETGARSRDGGPPAQHTLNYNAGETDLLATQTDRRHVVEDRERNFQSTTEDMRMPTLLPRPPITRQTEEEWEGRTRLSSNKRGRSQDGEEEAEPPNRSRRF